MARDVAQRELDQAGFRIANLGDPQAPNDATRTDNQSVPRQSAGVGSPGTSLLAAPADHVHPASPATPFSNQQDYNLVNYTYFRDDPQVAAAQRVYLRDPERLGARAGRQRDSCL